MDGKPRISFDDIRERAYELWERHHRPDGYEIEFWLLAERELQAERGRRTEATGAQRQEPSTRRS